MGSWSEWLPLWCSAASTSGRALSLQRLEALLGEQAFMRMLGGQHSHLTAAIKSLPLREGPTGGAAAEGLHEEERLLAGELRRQCQEALGGVLCPVGAPALESLRDCNVTGTGMVVQGVRLPWRRIRRCWRAALARM